jgi:DNA (cytosine-5)-methyltransferase 1
MDYSKKTREELIEICKQNKIKGYSRKKKQDIIVLLRPTPIETQSHDKYNVISLFSGMGGMDIGFSEQVVVHKHSVIDDYIHSPSSTPDFVNLHRLPFSTVFQNDILPEAKHIAELNKWNHNYHLKDIRDMLKDTFAFPQADVVTGGFPCQDFSHSGKRKGFDSSRGTLYQSFVEVVKQVKPLVFVAENVNGLLTMPGEPIKKIISDFSDVGYEVKYQLIKCEEYGIPQTRWRVIIMGVRLDKRDKLQDNWNIISENKKKCTIGHYFKHLQEPDVSSDPAQTVYSKAKRLEKGQGQKEVGLDEFAPTMRAEHHGNIEFRRIKNGKNKENDLPERRLTVREAALIQTFPPNCILTDPAKVSSKAYKPIGNAVPPLLGYIIGRKVQSILDIIKD